MCYIVELVDLALLLSLPKQREGNHPKSGCRSERFPLVWRASMADAALSLSMFSFNPASS